MRMTDEQLAAYVDGELDPAAARTVRRQVEDDPALGRQVRSQQALRERLRRSFDRTLVEPVPERLLAAVAGGRVVPLAGPTSRRMARVGWLGGLAAAAGIVLGVALAPSLTHLVRRQPDIVSGRAGLAADGQLAAVLSNGLASEQPADGRIRLGVSFLARTGGYCRTFVMDQQRASLSGMACRQDGRWVLQALQREAPPPAQAGGYRQAASTMSPLVLQAAEAAMVGDALDAQAEAAARDDGWRRPTTTRK